MDPAVALVQAYLQLNGYLTVTEFPIALHAMRLTQPALAHLHLLEKVGVLGRAQPATAMATDA